MINRWCPHASSWRWVACGLVTAGGLSAAPSERYSHGDPTVYEQYMLELVNRARLNPTAESTRYGITLNEGPPEEFLGPGRRQPLAFNPELILAARRHSQWMLDVDVFSHVGDGGSSPQDRMRDAGYVFTPPWSYGENIAWNGTTGELDLLGAIPFNHQNLFVDEGIEGRGHRVNLVNPSFREVGIGILEGEFTADRVSYNTAMVSQEFGATAATGSSFLLGVVFQDLDGDRFYTPGEGLAGVTVMPDRGTYYTTTSGAGGYALPLTETSGTLTVLVSQGPLATPIVKTVTLNGSNVKLDFDAIGDAPVATPSRLAAPRLLPSGRLAIAVGGTVGQTVDLEFSTDLSTWQTLQTTTLLATTTELIDAPPPSAVRRFYRVRGR